LKYIILFLTLSAHELEGYSSHFVCLSVVLLAADLEDGVLLAFQIDMKLKFVFF